MYHSIQFDSPAKIMVWCRRIISCPRLGPKVIHFYSDVGSVAWGPERVRDGILFRTSFYRAISQALRLVTQLRVLQLPKLLRGSLSCFHLFDGCTFKLVSLPSYFSFDHRLISFLEKQDEIMELKAFGPDRIRLTKALPDNILPNLMILIAGSYDRLLHCSWPTDHSLNLHYLILIVYDATNCSIIPLPQSNGAVRQ
jgi:hypothetical protein